MSLAKMNSAKKETILWAVDPTQNPIEAKNIIIELKVWAAKFDFEVQPVAIFSEGGVNFPTELSFPWRENFESVALRFFQKYLNKTAKNNFLPPKILLSRTSSHRKMAVEFARYAENNGARFIFANTRAKKTKNPFRLGGFAETLIAVARTPILLVNSTAKPSLRIGSILYPTDFSRESGRAFDSVGDLAKSFQAQIMLFNQIENPAIYLDSSLMWPAAIMNIETLLKPAAIFRKRKAHQWIVRAQRKGAKCIDLIQNQKASLSADILQLAKKRKVDLIALSSHEGLLSQRILGGTAHDILLQAHVPVLIFHRPKFQTTQSSFQ